MTDPLFQKDWKMDPELSSFSTSFTPESETRLYEGLEDGYKLTVTGSLGGEGYEWGYTAKYDGEAHPVYGREDVDSITIHKISDRITIGFFKRGLVPGGPYARLLSEDGQELMVEAAGRHVDGSPFYDVLHYRL